MKNESVCRFPLFCVYRSLLFVLCVCFLILALVPIVRWTRDYLLASETSLSFNDAVCVNAVKEGMDQKIQVIAAKGRIGILAHPPSRLEWTVQLRKGRHQFYVNVGIDEGAWNQDRSDGVIFKASYVQGDNERELFKVYVDPRHNETDRRWIPVNVAIRTNGDLFILALETTSGPAGNADFDWAYWAEPRILEATAPLNRQWVIIDLVGFFFCVWLHRRVVAHRRVPSGKCVWTIGSVCVYILFASLLIAGCTEIFFRWFPLQFPYSAYHYLPDDGLRYFREGTKREIYTSNGRSKGGEVSKPLPIGFLRRPCIRWSYRRQGDLISKKLVSSAYGESDPPVIDFQTDARGFRTAVDDPLWTPGHSPPSIIALGDSYTEAPQVQWNETWVSILAHEIGQPVRNLGVTGYSPQQCLMALRRFLDPERKNSGEPPKLVLFPLFENTFILKADRFKLYQDSRMLWPEFLVKSQRMALRSIVVRRLSFSFAWATLKYGGGLLRSWLWQPLAAVRHKEQFLFNPVKGEIAGSPVQIAFYDEYLYSSTFPKSRWEQCKGWNWTCETLKAARDLCDKAGVHLLVLVFPNKGSVYLPLLADAYNPRDFDRYVGRIAEDAPPDGRTWHESFTMNHRAVNELVRGFCEENNLDCLDLGPALRKAAQKGDLVYFPADTHWNPYGHCIVGETIADAITKRNLL